MEVIKERRGRAYAGKHTTRPVTVRYRTVPILSEGRREALEGLAGALVCTACIVVTGIVEGSTWPM